MTGNFFFFWPGSKLPDSPIQPGIEGSHSAWGLRVNLANDSGAGSQCLRVPDPPGDESRRPQVPACMHASVPDSLPPLRTSPYPSEPRCLRRQLDVRIESLTIADSSTRHMFLPKFIMAFVFPRVLGAAIMFFRNNQVLHD
ncbi:hypothetical protein CPAR01_16517 [Colletotrichum paranaense]|uniref:Uncharacterized protein n=1 Tax=Colletotrichum paranaense TaxID=1914294 RepID=A0ABQ9RVN1_9PEZI|nr:uncharacterized protein CPAR01_16517 [Colletotrichum paranaense]KAK1515994.1 hypothetical protein CPAR01_16517 [Colletotrichum paranaense]